MNLYEREVDIPANTEGTSLLHHLATSIEQAINLDEKPIRIAITHIQNDYYHCELGLLSELQNGANEPFPSIFDFRCRLFENSEQFNVVLIVPTGIGAEIGGDAGDASPVAKMLASQCDHLIIHPNVVNASDINEMAENCLYVEGSVLTRLLMGTIGLQKVRYNRVLVLLDEHEDRYFTDAAINSISAARSTIGLDCSVVKMDHIIRMEAMYSTTGCAIGKVEGVSKLLRLLSDSNYGDFDAMAITSAIDLPHSTPSDYFRHDLVNPWGGVEALLTHFVSSFLNVPSAHSPMMENREVMNDDLGIVDPRKAAEAVSLTFLHCILKGLQKCPRIVTDREAMRQPGVLTVSDISCVVIPDGCLGLPTLAALEQGIPVIAVRENRNIMRNDLAALPWAPGQLHVVENYWEAAGVLSAMKAGISPESVRRPLADTETEVRSQQKETEILDEEGQQLTAGRGYGEKESIAIEKVGR